MRDITFNGIINYELGYLKKNYFNLYKKIFTKHSHLNVFHYTYYLLSNFLISPNLFYTNIFNTNSFN